MPARHRSLLPYLAVATALLAAACGDNPLQPKKPADPLATAANIQALGTSFTSLPFQSFSFATTYVPTAASPMAALRPLLRAAQPTLVTRRALSLAESRLAATALRAALVPSSGAIAASIFPPGVVLGTTYTWNATTFQYEANDPAVVPGAPSNGVRFILYALDLAGQPIATQPIGRADFMDESSGNTQTLHVLVVGTTTDPPVTYLDYAVSVTVGTGTASAAVVGFITDGIERLDFNAAIDETSGSATFDIRFDVNAADAHVRLRMALWAPDRAPPGPTSTGHTRASAGPWSGGGFRRIEGVCEWSTGSSPMPWCSCTPPSWRSSCSAGSSPGGGVGSCGCTCRAPCGASPSSTPVGSARSRHSRTRCAPAPGSKGTAADSSSIM